MKKIKIDIPTPCHENWEKMTPTEKGRFCANCQKEVIDFTKMSDKEITRKLTIDNTSCGKFLSTQLNRDLVFHEQKHFNFHYQVAAAGLLLFSTSFIASAQVQNEIKTEIKQNVEDSTSAKSTFNLTTRTIQILDFEDLPIANMTIILLGPLESNAILTTDHNGRCSIDDTIDLTFISGIQIVQDKSLYFNYSSQFQIEDNRTIIRLSKEDRDYLVGYNEILKGEYIVGTYIVPKNKRSKKERKNK